MTSKPTDQIVAKNINTGLLLQQKGDLKGAIAAFKSASNKLPKNPELLYRIGMCYLQDNDAKRASNFLSKAVKFDSRNAELWSNLGLSFRRLNQFVKAADCFKAGLEVDPNFSACRYNLAINFKDLALYEEALECLEIELLKHPNNPQLYFTKANILCDAERYEDSIAVYKKATQLKPDYKEAWVNLGNACKLLANYDEGMQAYNKALELDPENHAVAVNKGMLLLQQGDYENGWPLYERRIEIVDFQDNNLRKIKSPRWSGEDISHKTILIYSEQGLGDTVQFIRYASWVKTLGARVVVYLDKALQGLVSGLEGVDQVVVKGEPIPKHDYRVSVMSLAGIYTKLSGNYTFKTPYLFAKPEFIEKWNERLSSDGKLKVGIVWQGNPDYMWDKYRSIPLEEFLPLLNNSALQIYALQVGDSKKQLPKLLRAHPELKKRIINVGEMIQKEGASFDDTAAIVSELDVVVAADTSMAHIAGSLGVKVMTALNVVPDWRWRHGTIQADYYDSMTLYRQSERKNWKPVFNAINTDLTELSKEI